MTDAPGEPAAEGADPEGVPAASVRGPELAVAGVLMLLALVVIGDSLRVGRGWDESSGPQAGYFPFWIGVLLFLAAGWIFVRTLLQWRTLVKPFVMRHEFSGVWAVGWPTVVYVALMPFTGLYVASALLIGWFMKRHGRYGWAVTAAVSIAVPLAFFLVFERWFLVPLPKGPLEHAFGL